MSWACFLTLLCIIRLSQCSICKLEIIIPTSQNLLWGWPCPHLHTYTLSGIHKPCSSFYGFRLKITRDRKENVFIRQLLLSALLQYSPWAKQSHSYLLSPLRGGGKGKGKTQQKKKMWRIASKIICPGTFMCSIYTSVNKNDGTIFEQWHIIMKSFTNIIINLCSLLRPQQFTVSASSGVQWTLS